jgi:hypothetical protein
MPPEPKIPLLLYDRPFFCFDSLPLTLIIILTNIKIYSQFK